MPNDHISKIAGIIEREVTRQTTVTYGDVDWELVATKVYRELITDKAMEAILGPGDRIRIDVPLSVRCKCKDPVVVHHFGRGTTCQMCGLPA